MLFMAALYMSIIWPSLKNKPIALSIKWVFYSGLLLRLIFIPSTPIWEDDFYRYFFDGALINEGVSPYKYAPLDAFERPPLQGAEALGITEEPTPPAPELLFLQNEALLDRVAYPHIKTIYPPVTQAVFALSSFLGRFDLIVWRLLLILVEVTSFILILSLLKQLNKSPPLIAIYWLNPLVITETINAGHMDALIVPFLILTLILLGRKKVVLSGVSLAFAVGIKLWPIILAPLLFRPYLNSLTHLLKTSIPFAVLTLVLLSPQLISALDQQAGVANYAQYWQTNSFLFMWLQNLISYISDYDFMPLFDASLVSRAIVALIIIAILIGQMKTSWYSIDELIKRCLVVIVSLFLLSPTGYPWYIIWFIPLVVVQPNKALLFLTLLLPLYDLRYPLEALGYQHIFDFFIVTAEFLPCLVLLGIVHYKKSNRFKKYD